MDEQTLQAWGLLHRRHVMGEALNQAERKAYESGCAELDAEEIIEGDIPRMRELRALIAQAEAEQQILRQREDAILKQIAEAESRLDPRSRQLLGIEN